MRQPGSRIARRHLAAAIAAIALVATVPVSLSAPAGAEGLTPFDTKAALYCDGTLQWSVTVGNVPGQRFTVGVDLVTRFAAAANTAKTHSGSLTADPSKSHAVLFRRIVEAKVEEAVSVNTGACIGTPPPPPPSGEIFVGIANSSTLEGNAGERAMVFTVSLSGPSTSPVTVTFATKDNAAQAGLDYVAKSGTITIPAGATTATISIAIKGDTVRERHEKFKVRLLTVAGASLGDRVAKGKIFNDDRRV